MDRRVIRWAVFCAAIVVSGAQEPAGIKGTFKAFGGPIRDEIFLQEVSRQISTKTPLLSVGISDGTIFTGSGDGLFQLAGGDLKSVEGVSGPIRKIVRLDQTLWAVSNDALYSRTDGSWTRISRAGVADITSFRSNTLAATATELFKLEGAELVPIAKKTPFSLEHIATFNESLYFQGGKRLSFFDGATFGGIDLYGSATDLSWDWGALPSPLIRDILADGASLYLATDRGLGVLRGMTLHSV